MDRIHMEPRYGMHEDKSGLQTLLCRANVNTPKGNGAAQLCQWIPVDRPRARARDAFALEALPDDLRELNERPVPQGPSFGVHIEGLRGDGQGFTSSVSSSHETFEAAARSESETAMAIQCLDGRQRGEL